MANGTGLSGNPGAQNSVIVKKPSSSSLYYIFTVQGGAGAAGLCYSIVNTTLSSGSGSVTVKNATLYPSPCEEKISATKHCNQTDAWVICRPVASNSFVTFPLTPAGMGTMVVSTYSPQSNSTITYTHTGASERGSLKFSPNGRRLAEVYSLTSPVPSVAATGSLRFYLETYKFDNNSGMVTDNQFIMGTIAPFSNAWAYGTEYSPDGTKFYFTYQGALIHVNYCVYPPIVHGSIPSFGDPMPTSQWRATLQLGPDGKIYVANPGTNVLGVIHQPNNAATSCSYQAAAISLGSNVSPYGLPNFYTSYFEKPSPLSITNTMVAGPNCRTHQFSLIPACPVLPNLSLPFSGYVVDTYNWNFGDPGSGSTNTSVASAPFHTFSSPGTYSVKLLVNYLCGKADSATHVVIVIPSHSVSITTPSISCAATTATASVSGYSGTLTYSWNPGNSTSSVVSGLLPGVHTVSVTDSSSGCTVTQTVNTNGSTIASSVNVLPACSNSTTGSATVIASGGSGAYTYSWSGTAQTGSMFTSIPLGNYTVIVTDNANNCTMSNTFNINQAAALQTIFSLNSPSTICTGESRTLTATITGGTPPYSGGWVAGPQTNTLPVMSLNSGTLSYNYTVTDLAGCSHSANTKILVVQSPTLVVNSAIICPGQQVTLTATGAQAVFWLPGLFNGTMMAVSPTISTTYTVIGNNGLCGTTASVPVVVLPVPQLTVSAITPICEGQSMQFNAQGANNYSWQGPAGFSSGAQNPFISNAPLTANGVYTVTGAGQNTCVATFTIYVQVLPKPIILVGSNSPLCVGHPLILTASGGLSYWWQGPSSFSNNLQNPVINNMTAAQAGMYSVTATGMNSCTASAFVNVVVNPPPTVSIAGPTNICAGQTASLVASGGISYLWNNGHTQPVLWDTPLNLKQYSVTVTDVNGCQSIAVATLSVSICEEINEQGALSDFRFYPNPHDSQINFEISHEVTVVLSDLNSRIVGVWQIGPSSRSIDTDELAPGLYFMEVKDLANSRLFKVVKHSK